MAEVADASDRVTIVSEENGLEYVTKAKDTAFKVGDWVCIVVTQDDSDTKNERKVHGVITGEGTDENNEVVPGTWNLQLPGWDSLHGKKDEAGRPQGGHIYSVRPLACSVPPNNFVHAQIPRILNVDSTGPKKARINGDYVLADPHPSHEGRPAWVFTHEDGTRLILCHKKQKGKPAWLISRESVVLEGNDGGYALFAQDLWIPSHKKYHLRGEVWGTWDDTSAEARWMADQSLMITEGPGPKKNDA